MKCPYCTAPNRETRKFCGHCGVILGWACSRCAFFNLLGEKHCGGCGTGQAGGAESLAVEGGHPGQSVTVSGRRAMIRDEIQHHIKDLATGAREDDAQKKRVSQDEIDHLFSG